jgi:hypothetical protein
VKSSQVSRGDRCGLRRTRRKVLKSATDRIVQLASPVMPLVLVVLCAATLALGLFTAPAYASRANEPAASSMSTSSSTPMPESEVLARSTTEPLIVKFHNRLTGKCLSTNFSYSAYTATCSTAEGQKWDLQFV